jgi:hypothetical protein
MCDIRICIIPYDGSIERPTPISCSLLREKGTTINSCPSQPQALNQRTDSTFHSTRPFLLLKNTINQEISKTSVSVYIFYPISRQYLEHLTYVSCHYKRLLKKKVLTNQKRIEVLAQDKTPENCFIFIFVDGM